MKWLLLLVIVVLALGGYGYYLNIHQPPRPTTNEVYLMRYASIVTANGVYGFPPGTRLTIDATRRPVTGQVFVTDGTHQLSVPPDALTFDADRARQAASEDAQIQTQATAVTAAEKARVGKIEADAQMNRIRDVERLNAGQHGPAVPAAPPPPPPPAPRH